MGDHISNVRLTTALENEGGTLSDHDTILLSMNVPQRHDFQWIRYAAHDVRKKSKEDFVTEYQKTDWEAIMSADQDVTLMTIKLHNKINK